MKQYNYYRAGILIARFQISADTVLCSPRDLKTMEFAPYVPFALPLKPFEADLDKRLADAVALLQQGALPEGYELMAEVSGGELKGEMWIQPLGKIRWTWCCAMAASSPPSITNATTSA